MKVKSVIRTSLVGIACASFALGTAAGGQQKSVKKHSAQRYAVVRPQVVFVEVTGSRIPQRVVLTGQQVNSGSPLYVVQGNELSRTGATSVAGMISLDPSVTRTR
jgi:hypothetical protein